MNDKVYKFAASTLLSCSIAIASAQLAKAAMTTTDITKTIADAKILDPRIQLTVTVEGLDVQVSMFVNPHTSTFEADCKDSALSIAKTILEADREMKKVSVQFKSYRAKDYKQIDVSQSDILSFDDGSLSKPDLLQRMEFKTILPEGAVPEAAQTGDGKPATTDAVIAAADVPSPADVAAAALKKHRAPEDKLDRELAAFRNTMATSNPKNAPTVDKDAESAATKAASGKAAVAAAKQADAVRLSQTYDDKNHLYKSEWMAFYYPEEWTHQRTYKNYWATPDERDIAQFVSKATPGAAVTAALYIGLSLEQKLDSEEKLAAVYNYEIIPRNVKIGYEEKVPAISLESVRKGQNGEELFFRRIYFMVGRQLCSLTLSCMNNDQQKMNTAFASLLGTIHSAHK